MKKLQSDDKEEFLKFFNQMIGKMNLDPAQKTVIEHMSGQIFSDMSKPELQDIMKQVEGYVETLKNRNQNVFN